MKRIAILGCVLGLYSTNLFAGSCDWATNTPADDAQYKYLVAKVYSDISAKDASTKAERDINSQLGRLFGVALDVQSDFYSDESTSAGTTRSYERSIGTIQLKGLERQKSDVTRESGGWTGCVQYRYSQKDLARERKRLEKLPADKLSHTPFTEVLGDTTCKGAPVEIRTVPENAFVTLDNGKYQGMSPIKFGNVCNGQHTLEISKENYKDVSEKLIVPSTKTINKTLTRDTKRITVSTSLGNSKISVNGVDYGKEPVKFNAPLGIEQTISAKHSEAVTVSRTRTFSKYSDDVFVMEMDKLPAKIDFSAFKVRNPDVQISVNGKTIKGNITGELSPDTEHRIKFTKKDFYDITKSINLRGGETTYYPSLELTFSKEPEYTAGLLFGIGGSFGDNIGGFNLDAGMDIKTKYLYLGAGLQLNILMYSKATMSFDRTISKHTFNTSAETDLKLIEPFYVNLGFNAGKNLSVFGVGTLGVLSGGGEGSSSNGLQMKETYAPLFRYGIGLQYGNKAGFRVSYLTGPNLLSPDDIKFGNINNYDDTPINISNRQKTNWPEQITSFNVTFFIRGVGEKK